MTQKNVYINGQFVGYGTTDNDKIDVWGISIPAAPTASEVAKELYRMMGEKVLNELPRGQQLIWKKMKTCKECNRPECDKCLDGTILR